jgi:hypothetical protein
MSALGVRRAKAALSSGCEPPGDRSTLGFEFAYLRSCAERCGRITRPSSKKRTALVRALKEVFRRHWSQPIERAMNYFAVGHSSECFSFIKAGWIRRSGAIWRKLGNERVGWERRNRRWLYDILGLCVRRGGAGDVVWVGTPGPHRRASPRHYLREPGAGDRLRRPDGWSAMVISTAINRKQPGCRRCSPDGRQNRRARYRERLSDPAWSETLACTDAPCAGTGRSLDRP